MYYHQSVRLYSSRTCTYMADLLLGARNISGKGAGESEVESELDSPRTQLTSDSEASEIIETSPHRILFKPLDTIYKASVHLRRAMVHISPHLIQKQCSFFGLDVNDIIVLFEYLFRF